jgi:hypothetical protein
MDCIDEAITSIDLREEGASFSYRKVAREFKVDGSCNDAGKTRDPNMAWSHSEAYGSAWENRNLRSIDTYRSCTKGLQETAYLHLGDCNVKYTKAMKC